MSRFERTSEFEKELRRLSAKFRSLFKDLERFEKVLTVNPTGIGKNFTIIYRQEGLDIVKARVACKSLRARSLRCIYAYYKDSQCFTYIELYHKGEKENEDRERIKRWLKERRL